MRFEETPGRLFLYGAASFLLWWPETGALAEASGQRGKRREVLIYYANENSPDKAEEENYRTIIGWLRSSDAEKLQQLADSFERDMRRFPGAVDREIEVFRKRLPALDDRPGAALFTNRGVRSGEFWVLAPDDDQFRRVPIDVPHHEHIILASNPLADEKTFSQCLKEVARHFAPTEFEFILITKSHGSREMALTPRLVIQADDVNREELIAFAQAPPLEHGRPEWAKRLGITRQRYFDILAHAGKNHGMRFPLVFTESCQGVLGEELKVKLPGNVGRLYTTGKETAYYQNLDYDEILGRCTAGTSLAQALEETLSAKYPGITRGSWGRWSLVGVKLLWWVPLLLWLAWVLARRRRRTRL